jgi:hypothetical protein
MALFIACTTAVLRGRCPTLSVRNNVGIAIGITQIGVLNCRDNVILLSTDVLVALQSLADNMPINKLKITGLSLLLGAAALIVGLTLFFGPQDNGDRQVPLLKWSAETARAEAGNATFINGEMQIELDVRGGAVARLEMGEVPARDYPYLHIELVDPPKGLSLAITWKTREGYHALTFEAGTQKSLWIATAELPDWNGDVSSLGLLLYGQPGQTVRIQDFTVYPASPWRQLAAIYSDLTGFIPWNRAAMNTYTGVSHLSSFYPIALTVTFLGLCLLAYGVLLLAFRKRVHFDWSVIALLFLACWVILDLVWQNRLLQQLADTHRLFSGKSTAEKLAAGPDAKLVNFVSQIEPLLGADNARVFVASSDQYSGMRTAYYLFPRNVFWSLHLQELPVNTFLRKGDYIALVKPTDLRFNEEFGALFGPERARLRAQLLYTDRAGSLLRLN